MNTVTARAMALALMSLPAAASARDGVQQDDPVSVDSRAVHAPVATLARSIAVRYEMFTLPNGLRVVVHTDRSVKTVGVGVEYAVG